MKREIICTVCPNSCRISLEGEGDNIVSLTGFSCPRGEKFARQEFIRPMRILTSSVKLAGKEDELLPVRSDRPLPLSLMTECMNEIRKVSVKAPVSRHDIIIKNICGTGANIIATGRLEE